MRHSIKIIKPFHVLLLGTLALQGCASNKVTKDALLSLQAQVKEMEQKQNERRDYDRNALVMTFKLHDSQIQLMKKLCGIRFVVNSRTIQMTPENGYPIPEECLITPILTKEELDFMGSYLTISDNQEPDN